MFWGRFYGLCLKNNTKPIPVVKTLGIAAGSVTKWKNGTVPNGETLDKIADFFHVSVDYLLGRDEPESEDVVYYEIIGSVSAGYDGIAVEQHTGETTPIPSAFLSSIHRDDFFVLRVSGDSMYPKILDGDLVLVQRCSSVDSGSIAVIMYNGDEATVKKVKYVSGEDWFEMIPFNPEYQTKRIEGPEIKDCRVLGKVVKLIRDV